MGWICLLCLQKDKNTSTASTNLMLDKFKFQSLIYFCSINVKVKKEENKGKKTVCFIQTYLVYYVTFNNLAADNLKIYVGSVFEILMSRI